MSEKNIQNIQAFATSINRTIHELHHSLEKLSYGVGATQNTISSVVGKVHSITNETKVGNIEYHLRRLNDTCLEINRSINKFADTLNGAQKDLNNQV